MLEIAREGVRDVYRSPVPPHRLPLLLVAQKPRSPHPRPKLPALGRKPRDLIEVEPDQPDGTLSMAAIERAIAEHGPRLALVLWPGIQYRTG